MPLHPIRWSFASNLKASKGISFAGVRVRGARLTDRHDPHPIAEHLLETTYILIIADHGHNPVVKDDRHAIGTGDDTPFGLLKQAGFACASRCWY